jgi:hypothetical protein
VPGAHAHEGRCVPQAVCTWTRHFHQLGKWELLHLARIGVHDFPIWGDNGVWQTIVDFLRGRSRVSGAHMVVDAFATYGWDPWRPLSVKPMVVDEAHGGRRLRPLRRLGPRAGPLAISVSSRSPTARPIISYRAFYFFFPCTHHKII